MKKVAIFDIDNTIISNDSWVNFVKEIVNRTKLPFFTWIFIYFTAVLYVCHILKIEKLKNIWLKLISELNETELDDFCKKYVSTKVLPFIKPGVKEKIEQLKQEGFVIIFATASLEIYAKYIAADFNTDIFVGTKIIKKNGQYLIDGKNCKKSEKINRILQKIDINEIDLQNSISFSDSLSDLPFLDISNTFNLVHKTFWQTLKTYTK